MAAPSRRKGTPTYAFTNPHPNGIISHDDCAYRAICIATGKDWLTVYDELTALGRELLCPPNGKLTINTYMDRIADRIEVMSFGKRATGKTVARLDATKTYVVRMAGHLVCVKDGKVRDTWNSTEKAAYIIWELR